MNLWLLGRQFFKQTLPRRVVIAQTAWGLNFRRTFICCVSFISELAGSNLVDTAQSSPSPMALFICVRRALLSNKKKDLVVQSHFRTNITQLSGSNVKYNKGFHKSRQFLDFSSASSTLVMFSIKIDDFGFDFHKISLSGIVGSS